MGRIQCLGDLVKTTAQGFGFDKCVYVCIYISLSLLYCQRAVQHQILHNSIICKTLQLHQRFDQRLQLKKKNPLNVNMLCYGQEYQHLANSSKRACPKSSTLAMITKAQQDH